jgi:hypothetical protein
MTCTMLLCPNQNPLKLKKIKEKKKLIKEEKEKRKGKFN